MMPHFCSLPASSRSRYRWAKTHIFRHRKLRAPLAIESRGSRNGIDHGPSFKFGRTECREIRRRAAFILLLCHQFRRLVDGLLVHRSPVNVEKHLGMEAPASLGL